jgi:hypothetical protein
VEGEQTGKIINIIGRGIGAEDAPKGIESWGVNIVMLRRELDVGFDMHEDGKMTDEQMERRRQVIPWMAAKGIPVYAVHAIPGTTYRRYPIEKVIQKFKTGYFSNAVCYMIALALLEGVDKLNFYGVVHLRTHEEYAIQKPAVDYWMGRAEQMGVECYVHGDYSEIGRTEDGLAYGYKLTAQEMIRKYGN